VDAQYFSIGQVLPGLDPSFLEHEESKRLLVACHRSPAFEVVELRRLERRTDGETTTKVVDGIVVDCCDGTVPSRNPVGIKNRERLILLYRLSQELPHEVRALRSDFPSTLHQNQVQPGDAASLCLYFESWSSVERTWTPANHLQRILWWLRETALGTLHRSDQPLERMYLIAPYQIVLPADFHDRASNPSEVLQLSWARSKGNGKVMRALLTPKDAAKAKPDSPGMDSLVVRVPPALASGIERYPATLGQLHDQLTARNSELATKLTDAVKKLIPQAGLPIRNPDVQHTLLVLQIPAVREKAALPERTDAIGFLVHDAPLATLGIACDAAFDGKDGKAYANNSPILGIADVVTLSNGQWRALTIEPVDVRIAFDPKDARRASGVPEDGAEFEGVLAGVGALGSCMADLWSRAGWGHWTYIDHDTLHPHNIVRHTGKDPHIGWQKVDAVVHMAKLNWPSGSQPIGIPEKVTNIDKTEVKGAIAKAQLLVDASTTLEVPRDLSDGDDCPRMVSTFFTPSGRDSVLLLEDSSRTIRLHAIEAQYYRAVLNNGWGETHLRGHYGTYWVGGGCRDLSGVLSYEVVQLHGSTLARQVRLLSTKLEAQIRIWMLDEDTGALTCELIAVAKPKETTLFNWRVIWDEGFEEKLRHLRQMLLPLETGGIILGYVDQKRRAIHIVDAWPAPRDSTESTTEFVRGADGVRDTIEEAASKTANIVGYLGEWHSHPSRVSAIPSTTDGILLTYLAKTLAMDGVPALMVIVGEGDISISLGEGQTP
jgi:Prokaryotic E2 family A/Prokaryotic homologs of the JAB domain/ThiF family